MDKKSQAKFSLGFKRFGFPLRLILESVLGVGAIALTLGHYPPNPFAALMVLFSILFIIALSYLIYPLIRGMKMTTGIVVSWYIFILAPSLIYLLLPGIDALRVEYLPAEQWLAINQEITHIYLWVLGLFIIPISLGIEQLLFAQTEVQTLEKESEITDLDFRIRPHFLFNSLNSVASLITIDPVRAEDGLIDLSDMFRVILTDKRKLVPFSAEQEMAFKYMSLEKMRLGDRLEDEWEIDNVDSTTLLPTLTLQPLIENAIYHGIETRLKGGTVSIKARENRDYLYITITNPIPEADKPVRKGNQIAQQNLINRFAYLYKGKGAINHVETDTLYTVTIKVPRRIAPSEG